MYPILSSPDLTQQQKIIIYTSLKGSQILYACQASGHTTKNTIHKLQVIQNSAARTIITGVEIILSFVLYGCETWTLTLKEECKLRVFEDKFLRRIFGHKRDANGEWGRPHKEELNSLYRYIPNIVRVIKSRRLRWAGHIARMEEGRTAFKILTGTPTGKRPLGGTILEWMSKK